NNGELHKNRHNDQLEDEENRERNESRVPLFHRREPGHRKERDEHLPQDTKRKQHSQRGEYATEAQGHYFSSSEVFSMINRASDGSSGTVVKSCDLNCTPPARCSVDLALPSNQPDFMTHRTGAARRRDSRFCAYWTLSWCRRECRLFSKDDIDLFGY